MLLKAKPDSLMRLPAVLSLALSLTVAALSSPVQAAGPTSAPAPGKSPSKGQTRSEMLEVAPFESFSMLTDTQRDVYVGHLRKMMVDLAASDQGTDTEYFGGNDDHSHIALSGWRAGYYAIASAFREPAAAQDWFGGADSVYNKGIDQETYDAEKAKIEARKPTLAEIRAGASTKGSTQYEAFEGKKAADLKALEARREAGQFEEKAADNENRERARTANEAAIARMKADREKIANPGMSAREIRAGVTAKGSTANIEWQKKIDENLKKFDETAKARYGIVDLIDPEVEKNLCKYPKITCAAPSKGQKASAERKKKLAAARGKECIYGGIKSRYKAKDGTGTGDPDVKPGNCLPVTEMQFGSVTVQCDPKKKDLALCNPLLFDTPEPIGDVAKSGTVAGRCVQKSSNMTARCDAEYKKDPRSKAGPFKHFWDSQIPGIQEEYQRVAASLNQTCGDSSSQAVQCRECQIVQRSLATTGSVYKDCRPKAVPLPPKRPTDLSVPEAGSTNKSVK